MLRLLRLRTDGLRVQSSANSEGGVDIMKSLNGGRLELTGLLKYDYIYLYTCNSLKH